MDTSASTGNSDDLRDKFRQGPRELSPALINRYLEVKARHLL